MTPNTNSSKYKTRTATYDRKYLAPVSGKNRIKTEKWKVSLKQLFHKISNAPSGPYFDYISHLLFQKSSLSTSSFSTKVNAKELICIPHAHIPRHLKHSLSWLLRIAKGLLHFANSIRKRWESQHKSVMYVSSHVGTQMHQLHFERPASNPMLFLNFIYLFIFPYIYLHTNVSTYFTVITLYYTGDTDRAFLE